MQVAILAGGLATRLRPTTDSIPKSMIEIEGKPFIEYQLDMLSKQRITDVVLCIGYLGDQIERHVGDGCKFGVKVKYSYEEKKLLGTAGALKNAEHLLNEQFFVIYGDSYLFLDFAAVVAYLKRFNKLGLMAVYKNNNQFDKSNVVIENNLVKVYDKKHKIEGMHYIDYGAMLLRKRLLDLIPDGQFCALEDVLIPVVEQGELLAYKVQKRFYEVGSIEGINEFRKYIKKIGTKP